MEDDAGHFSRFQSSSNRRSRLAGQHIEPVGGRDEQGGGSNNGSNAMELNGTVWDDTAVKVLEDSTFWD